MIIPDALNTARNVAKCGDFFYFVSSDLKLVQIDTSKVELNGGNGCETVIAGQWSGKVEDFVVRSSTRLAPRVSAGKKFVDLAVLTSEKGQVFEFSVDLSSNTADAVKGLKLLADDSDDAQLKEQVEKVNYWNNIIEIEVMDRPTGKKVSTYLVSGYMILGMKNILISPHNSQLSILRPTSCTYKSSR